MKNLLKFGNRAEDVLLGPEFRYIYTGFPPKVKGLSIGSQSVIDASIIIEQPDATVSIGRRVHIGGKTKLITAIHIEIQDDVTMAWGCTVMDHDSHALEWEYRAGDTLAEVNSSNASGNLILTKDWTHVARRPIVIERRAWIGFEAVILKGVRIGEGAVVGARAVVTKDVAPYSVVAGNPARFIKRIERHS